ncbi:MAG: hypothetical protein C4582_13930 [Desulfobacteraceae bacterium]|jgi:hypothetical protein|nr:MAG: hypothetical protein C4582_13930 [Desulfobacteraceae bacterium]
MGEKKSPPDGEYQIRCPRLGHHVSFLYCRYENKGLPCFKTLDCWFEHFPVEEYLRNDLSSEDWDKVFENLPKSKVVSLLELIEQAKKRNQERI